MPIRDTSADRKHTFANYCPDDVRTFSPFCSRRRHRSPSIDAGEMARGEVRATAQFSTTVATTREHACKNAQHAFVTVNWLGHASSGRHAAVLYDFNDSLPFTRSAPSTPSFGESVSFPRAGN